MLIYAPGGPAMRGDLIRRVVLRSDLTPIPATVEVEVRLATETERVIRVDQVIEVGSKRTPMRLVKVERLQGTGAVQGDREVAYLRATGLLDACAPAASRLQRAIVRERATLGEIYRAFGARVTIGSDFAVPSFACYVGMTPTFEVAKALQEEAGVLILADGLAGLQFRRLRELVAQAPNQYLEADQTQVVESSFLERHAIPFAFTTAANGGFVVGRREAARGVAYRPRGDERIVRNLSAALVLRRTYRNVLTPDVGAGTRFDVGGKPLVAITAAHVYESQGTADSPEQFSKFWLGELVE